MKSPKADNVLPILKLRFDKHPRRHAGLAWPEVAARLETNAKALHSLSAMEASGGEPDVVGRDAETGCLVFVDCAAESPAGRRSTCYDAAARLARKEHQPASSALEMAEAMGVRLLTEQDYRALQELGEFDLKTSSWISTPDDIRALGGALFCDRRYGKVFVYHNGVQSYYAARGFRGVLMV